MEARQDKRLVQIFMKETGTVKNSILDGGRMCRQCGDSVGRGGDRQYEGEGTHLEGLHEWLSRLHF